MSPTRRHILRTVAGGLPVALAGCGGLRGSDAPVETTRGSDAPVETTRDFGSSTAPEPTPTRLATDATAISTLRGTEGRTFAKVAISVEVDRQFTPDHPAHLTVEVENISDDTLDTFYPPTLFLNFTSEPPGLLLVPDYMYMYQVISDNSSETESTTPFAPVPTTTIDGCWHRPSRIGDILPQPSRTIFLDPGDVLSDGYTVLDSGDDGCLRPDSYRFEGQFRGEWNVFLACTLDLDEDGTLTVTAVQADQRKTPPRRGAGSP